MGNIEIQSIPKASANLGFAFVIFDCVRNVNRPIVINWELF
jgi:hypothetical protein